MPQQSAFPDPYHGDLGSRKRKARLDDDGQPVVSMAAKKMKAVSHPSGRKKSSQQDSELEKFTPKAIAQQSSSETQQRSCSVKIEDIPDEEPTRQRNTSQRQQHIIEEIDDGDDRDDDYVDIPDVHDMAAEDFERPEEDDEAKLERMSKKWASPIYLFFKKTPRIEYKDGRPSHVFECNASECKGKNGRDVRRFLDKGDAGSTSNLRKHAKVCWGDETIQAVYATRDLDDARDVLGKPKLRNGSMNPAKFVPIGEGKMTFSHHEDTMTEARAEIIRWVAESKRPFDVVKDQGFIRLMKMGRPDYHIPSPQTVSRDVKNVFVRVRKRIAKMLQEYDGALSFATDAWPSPNNKAYVAVTVHFEDKGVPVSMLLDIVEIPRSQSGINLATAFAKVLDGFGIGDKILNLTCNNTANNNEMIAELTNLVPRFSGGSNQTCCFAQILSLVVKSILRQFDVLKANNGQGLDDALNEPLNFASDIDLEEAEYHTLNSAESDGDEDGSVQRWIDERYVALVEERDELNHLRDVLAIFKDASLFVSRNSANIATVIPAMDHLDSYLVTAISNPTYSVALKAALVMGKKMLNQHYNKTDHAKVYKIAMVLHPRHKLQYFRDINWEQKWIDAAKDVVRMEFNRSYHLPNIQEISDPRPLKKVVSKNIFDNLSSLIAPRPSVLRDELDRYLSTDPEDVQDALLWWYERKNLYPRLHRMALDYLTIPPTSVDVKRTFSQSNLVLSRVRNRLSVQSTRALMCLGIWNLMGYVHDSDVKAAALLPEVDGDESELAVDWDAV